MTPEQQRIAIAEACPSVFGIRKESRDIYLVSTGDDCDPLNDLNAMHEAEKAIFETYDRSAWFRYIMHLENCCYCGGNATHMDHLHATAAQRAEAFLKTIGKWKEEA